MIGHAWKTLAGKDCATHGKLKAKKHGRHTTMHSIFIGFKHQEFSFIKCFFLGTMASSSTGERASKLRRLQSLRQTVPHVTQAALSAILGNVKQHGLPELSSEKHMREGNRLALDQASAYGPLHEHREFQCLDGSKVKIGILNLFSFLHFAFKAGGSLYETMRSWAGPLGVIFYTDELVVGNPLAHSPRKLWAVYFFFGQYGQQLQNENAWITMCLVRSSIVQKLDGNLSSLMREILLASVSCV